MFPLWPFLATIEVGNLSLYICAKSAHLRGGVLKMNVLHFGEVRDGSLHDVIIKKLFKKNYKKIFISAKLIFWDKSKLNKVAQLNFEVKFRNNGRMGSYKMLIWQWQKPFFNDSWYQRRGVRDGRKCYNIYMEKLHYINLWHGKSI